MTGDWRVQLLSGHLFPLSQSSQAQQRLHWWDARGRCPRAMRTTAILVGHWRPRTRWGDANPTASRAGLGWAGWI